MTSPNRCSRWIAFLFIVLSVIAGQFLLPSHLVAQVGSSDVLGTVTDSSGAVVVGAKVTIKDLNTSATRVATTDSNGGYIFNTLPNSQFTLTFEMQGFKASTISNIQLSAGVRLRQDAKLATGSVTETVQVTSVAALMQTDSSEVSSTVAESVVQDLPLNNRSFESALQVQPGMSMGTTSGQTSFAAGGNPEDRRQSFVVVANGQSDSLNNQLIDGFDNNERNLGLAGVRPSIDGIAEVKLNTGSYSAEYGRAAGAIVNVITKSGANDFHGSVYEYFRNDIFNAWNRFDHKKPEYRLNSYGGSFGGPVTIPGLYNGKNKTFFFTDWEGSRKIQGMAGSQWGNPTLFEEQSVANGDGLDLSDVINGTDGSPCGPESMDPANPVVCDGILKDPELDSDGNWDFSHAYNWVPDRFMSPVMKNYFLMMPAPNVGVNHYTNNPNLVQNQTNFDVRIDEHIGANDVLFGRFARNPVYTLYPAEFDQITEANATPAQKAAGLIGLYPGGYGGSGFPGPSTTKSYNTQIDYVHIFSSKLLLDLKAGYTRVNINSLPYNYDNGAAQKLGFGADVNTQKTIPSVGAWGPQLGAANSVPLADVNNTFQYAGSLTYTVGSHSLKMGGGLIRRQVNSFQDSLVAGMFGFDSAGINPFAHGRDSHYWDARENFIAGFPSMLIQGDALTKTGFRTWEYSGYLQDDWRVNRKLTVNMGVRYDIFTPFTEAHGKYTNFLVDCLTSNSIATDPNGCWVSGDKNPTVGVKTDYKNISPRFGLAYSLDSSTVIRAGFGMSYFPPDVGETSGGGPPASVMQNFNPPNTFNYAAMDYNLIWGDGCTLTTAGEGVAGCFDLGPKVPTPEAVSLNGYLTNENITAVSAKATNLRSSYVMMMNLAVQRQFGTNNSVTIGYVGELGRELLRTFNADQYLPGESPLAATQYRYPVLQAGYTGPGSERKGITNVTYSYNAPTSSYHALQLVYGRSLSHGLTVNANYTWSHNLTSGANIATNSFYAGWDANIDFGNSFMDLRHRIAMTASYELPFGKNSKGVVAAVAKGWKLNEIGYWQTGSPFTVSGNYDLNTNGLRGGGRLDQIGNPNSGPKTLDNWFNKAAFDYPDPGTIGTEKVNQVFGPHQRAFDLSLNKDFAITEKLKTQFRAECFNISNTPNLGTPNGGMSRGGPGGGGLNPDYGKITSTNPGSNPREFQFALKLLF
jgi:outer membrane receptor protein involved in Fe transport